MRFDAGFDHGDGGEAFEARFVRIAPLAAHPADIVRDHAAARLDAAMALVGVGEDIQLAVGRAVKIQLDLGMGGLLIVLCGQQIIAAKVDDLFGNVRLAALLSKSKGRRWTRGRPSAPPGGKLRHKQRDCDDFIGFFRHGLTSKHQIVRRRIGRDQVQGRLSAPPVMAAPRCFAPHPELAEGQWRSAPPPWAAARRQNS